MVVLLLWITSAADRWKSVGSGWRWLDVRALVERVVARHSGWTDGVIERIVYCTARVDGRTNPSGQADQDVYLKALLAVHSVDHIEYGTYVARAKRGLLAYEDRRKPAVVLRRGQ